MHYLYIIYSTEADKYYVGETSDIERRMAEHITGAFKGSFTSRARDWELRIRIEFDDINKARKAEAFIKRTSILYPQHFSFEQIKSYLGGKYLQSEAL